MEVHEDAPKVAARAAFRGLIRTHIRCTAMSRCDRSIRIAAPVQVVEYNSGQAQVGRHDVGRQRWDTLVHRRKKERVLNRQMGRQDDVQEFDSWLLEGSRNGAVAIYAAVL